MSLVSILVILVDDDVSNKVKFVLIHMCDKWCETLHPYYITQHTLHCFGNHIYLSYIFISIHIYLCVGGVCFYRGIEFDISNMLWESYCSYPHLHANWHCLVILHLFHLLPHVYLLLLQCLFLYLYVVLCLNCCMLKYSYIKCIFFYMFIQIL